MDVVAGEWSHFDRYEVVEVAGDGFRFGGGHLFGGHCYWGELLIQPSLGASLTSYSVAEAHERLGHARAPYNELARVGARLRDWYFREPFGPYLPGGSERRAYDSTAEVDLAEETGCDAWVSWLREAGAQGLHKPVLEWAAEFGLLGVGLPEFTSGPKSPRTYREDFTDFAEAAVFMDLALRGLRETPSPDQQRRNESVGVLNRMLGHVGLSARNDGRHLTYEWKSTSLLGYLAAMACLDLSHGLRIGVCERCAQTFTTRRRDKRLCSTRCRAAEKKARQRGDPAYREAELARQRNRRQSGNRQVGPSRESGQDKSKERKGKP